MTRITIRGIDPQIYRHAKSEAARLGITIGEYVNQALYDKLEEKHFEKYIKKGNKTP